MVHYPTNKNSAFSRSCFYHMYESLYGLVQRTVVLCPLNHSGPNNILLETHQPPLPPLDLEISKLFKLNFWAYTGLKAWSFSCQDSISAWWLAGSTKHESCYCIPLIWECWFSGCQCFRRDWPRTCVEIEYSAHSCRAYIQAPSNFKRWPAMAASILISWF